jgi:uncharacterized membrane protein YkoI
MRKLITAIALGTIAATAMAATSAPKPKLTLAQARVIALKTAPGRVANGDHQKEKALGVTSFDIRYEKMNHEAGADANTGQIVESLVEPLSKAD